jgi:hypothetical protein
VHDPDASEEASHAEVLAAGDVLVPRLIALLCGILVEMAEAAR